MHPIYKYNKEFLRFVEITDKVHRGKYIRILNGYEKTLVDKLKAIPRHNKFSLQKEDIYQQLAYIWQRLLTNRQHKDQGERAYLLRLSIFELRDWYQKLMSSLDHDIESEPVIELQDPDFSIHWVFFGHLANMSKLEKYIIFLRFNKGLGIKNISKITHSSLRYVTEVLQSILEYFRRIYV